MNVQPPHEFSVDPSAPRLPEDFPLPPADSGEVVLLLAEREASRAGWTAVLALEIARDWAARGRTTFLADGDLLDAPLHPLAGLPNVEGISDLLHFGASPTRVARPAVEGEFLFISAGTSVADPAESYRHPRWAPILRAFRESGSLFLLYLPADAPGVDSLLAEGDRILRLTEEASSQEEDPGITRILGGGRSTAGPDAPVEVSEAVEVDAIAPEPVAPPAPVDAPEAVVPEAELSSAPPDSAPIVLPKDPVRSGGSRDRTRPPVWLLFVLLLVLVALLVAGWMGVLNIPGVTPAEALSLLEAIGAPLDRLG